MFSTHLRLFELYVNIVCFHSATNWNLTYCIKRDASVSKYENVSLCNMSNQDASLPAALSYISYYNGP